MPPVPLTFFGAEEGGAFLLACWSGLSTGLLDIGPRGGEDSSGTQVLRVDQELSQHETVVITPTAKKWRCLCSQVRVAGYISAMLSGSIIGWRLASGIYQYTRLVCGGLSLGHQAQRTLGTRGPFMLCTWVREQSRQSLPGDAGPFIPDKHRLSSTVRHQHRHRLCKKGWVETTHIIHRVVRVRLPIDIQHKSIQYASVRADSPS